MLDDYNCIAALCQALQDLNKLMNIRKVKSCRRLIQNINGTTGTAFAEFSRKLDSLRFSTRKFGRWLSKTDIRKSYIIECLNLSLNGRNVLEESKSLFHRHIQNIVNTLVFVFYFQCLTVISFAFADFTWYINICKEMHLNLDDTITTAGFAASAFDIKTETSFLIATCFGISCRCKQITDLIKHTCIGCRIGTRCTSDR